MRFSPKTLTPGFTKEEKEARLKVFVSRHLDTHRATRPAAAVYRLLALSAESPVARALKSLAPELSAAGIAVEAILARPSSEASLDFATCRFVTDARLLDAHEQLVLDEATVWIGDCMRRDHGKRDSLEHFSETSPETARYAARSFTQLWRAAGPSGSLTAGRAWNGPRLPALFDPSLLALGEAAPMPALLRH